MRKIIFIKCILIFFVSLFIHMTAAQAADKIAQQGCCSWHNGVCGCSNGRVVCCDDTYSPSCQCLEDGYERRLICKNTYVKPYVRSNGTYVKGHTKTSPNKSVYDNWSTKGNTNPYTGKSGTKDPYKVNTKSKNKSYSW